MALPPGLTGQQLFNFIGGRRRYNYARQFKATQRQWRIFHYWAKNPQLCQADLGRHFRVSRATISRDIKALKTRYARYHHCPLCEGAGRLDIGPDPVTTLEVASDLRRVLDKLYGDRKPQKTSE